nr:MAG TPA: 4Fe-4S single cluster domain protein [Caudoviricetes sp.]
MNYALIRKMDISNEEGLRVSLFVSGCNRKCFNCYNKEAQDFNYGNLFTKKIFDNIITLLQKPYISGLSMRKRRKKKSA